MSGLTATPDPLVFPNAVVGGTACGSPGGTACTYGTITIANNLGTAQTISGASADGPFWVTWGGTCNDTANNKTIASHGSCTLELGFAPTAATTTNGTGTINFASGLVLNVGLRGTGVSGLTATPDPLVFPNAVVGGTACGSPGGTACTYGTITIANNLGTAQTISGASADGPFWVTWGGTCNSTANNKTIASHGSCTLELGFAPTAATTTNGTGTINFASGLVLKFGLRGTGVSGLTATPDPLVFPNAVVGGTACGSPGGTACTYGTITIANNLGTAQTISGASADGPFWVTWGGTCNDTAHNKTIASHGSCTLELGFAPTAAGTDLDRDRHGVVLERTQPDGRPQGHQQLERIAPRRFAEINLGLRLGAYLSTLVYGDLTGMARIERPCAGMSAA